MSRTKFILLRRGLRQFVKVPQFEIDNPCPPDVKQSQVLGSVDAFLSVTQDTIHFLNGCTFKIISIVDHLIKEFNSRNPPKFRLPPLLFGSNRSVILLDSPKHWLYAAIHPFNMLSSPASTLHALDHLTEPLRKTCQSEFLTTSFSIICGFFTAGFGDTGKVFVAGADFRREYIFSVTKWNDSGTY